MTAAEQEILAVLESITAELQFGSDQADATVRNLIERRGVLIERLLQSGNLDRSACERLAGVLQGGMEVERRLAAYRNSLQLQLAEMDRGLRLLNEVSDGLNPSRSTLDLRG